MVSGKMWQMATTGLGFQAFWGGILGRHQDTLASISVEVLKARSLGQPAPSRFQDVLLVKPGAKPVEPLNLTEAISPSHPPRLVSVSVPCADVQQQPGTAHPPASSQLGRKKRISPVEYPAATNSEVEIACSKSTLYSRVG